MLVWTSCWTNSQRVGVFKHLDARVTSLYWSSQYKYLLVSIAAFVQNALHCNYQIDKLARGIAYVLFTTATLPNPTNSTRRLGMAKLIIPGLINPRF